MFCLIKKLGLIFVFLCATLVSVARVPADAAPCALPSAAVAKLNADFVAATQTVGGGLFTPKLMWAAVVDREGRLCSIMKNGDAWPGSRAIAIAKASTANDFSNSKLALSTANLYGAVLEQGSLFGLNNSNTFNAEGDDPQRNAVGYVPGGIITFGGGVPLYSHGAVVGGLGVSGDTACADHDVAYTARKLAIAQNIVSPPPNNDNIVYEKPVIPGHFTHPFCLGGEVPPANNGSTLFMRRR